MSAEPIYTDKDYLDTQFKSLHDRLDKLDPLVPAVAVLQDWRVQHTNGHSRSRKLKLAVLGLVLSAAGLLSRFTA
jgi:hypothetical protein